MNYQKHFQSATIGMNPKNITQCVDWRTQLVDNTNWMSVPWASVWQFAVILSVFEELLQNNLDNTIREELFNEFLISIWWKANFNYHVDQHSIDNNKNLSNTFKHWCGHIWLIVSPENREEYWLSKDSWDFIEKKVSDFVDSKNIVNLQWNHDEQWAIIITSLNYTISANYNSTQFFIYTQWASQTYYNNLSPRLLERFSNIDVNETELADKFNLNMDQSAWRTLLKLTKKDNFPLHIINHNNKWKIEKVQNLELKKLLELLWI